MTLPNMTLNRHWNRHPPRPVPLERGRGSAYGQDRMLVLPPVRAYVRSA